MSDSHELTSDSKRSILLIGPLALSLGIMTGLAASTPIAHAQEVSDFTSDVRHARQDGASDAAAGIASQDHRSAWDEFGTNSLVDGAAAPADIRKSVVEDVAADLRLQLAYDQKDERYLHLLQSSPEEVQAAEGDGGNDLLPENYVEPHPSLDANPDVNPSALDVPTTSVDASEIPSSMDTALPSEDVSPLPADFAPPTGVWQPDDIKVFEEIIDTSGVPAASSEPRQDTSAAPSPAPTPVSDEEPSPGSDAAPPPSSTE